MAVIADLDTLKQMLGVKTASDDAVLQQGLDAAQAYVAEQCYASALTLDPVAEATLLLAARLYKRRLSSEGVAGWNELGVVRIIATDPDITRLLERYLDMTRVGVA
jgi:Phage gp6-like head-tail connector protein